MKVGQHSVPQDSGSPKLSSRSDSINPGLSATRSGKSMSNLLEADFSARNSLRIGRETQVYPQARCAQNCEHVD